MAKHQGLGRMDDIVAFFEAGETTGAGGVTSRTWIERHKCYADFIYQRGEEPVEAARREGRATYKVRIAQSAAARFITTAWIMRDTKRYQVGLDGVADAGEYAIREIDFITDRRWIYVVVESGLDA